MLKKKIFTLLLNLAHEKSMRKSTIGLLAGVMLFAFAILLYLQVNYIRDIVRTQDEQFRGVVKRSLFQVVHNLELDEASRILRSQILTVGKKFAAKGNPSVDRIIRNRQQLIFKGSENWTEKLDLNIGDDITIQLNNLRGAGKSSLNSQFQIIQKSLYERYYTGENLLNEVIRQMMKADQKPIEERIELKQLESYIESELVINNLALPFQYAIVDNNRNVIYKSLGFEADDTKEIFSQILFPNDPPSKLYTLQVSFPTRKKFVLSSVKFIFPSIVFSALLLVVFTITIYIIMRQKRFSEMKKDFISNMTHELKTPVTSISIAGQMLSDESLIATLEQSGSLRNSASFNKITRTITDETKRLLFLIDKVLQMSLMEDGRSILKIKKLDANDLLLKVARIFDIQVEKCGGALKLELEAVESTIYVDEMHFTNVLFNLMENAVKYRRPNIPLALVAQTENADDQIRISIRDNGNGIRKENLKKIFDRFYRVHTGNVHDVKGFGLGLAYVKKIVEELGGTIKVESEWNIGTKFIISLPYVQ